jgi:Prephenate dehydratase
MIGFLGPEHSFTHQALLRYDATANAKEYPSIRSLFVGLRLGEVDQIIVPIENSTEGSVTSTMDSLVEDQVYIIGEMYLPIQLQLYSNASSIEQITHVISHPQALAQSRQTLERLLGHYIEVLRQARQKQSNNYFNHLIPSQQSLEIPLLQQPTSSLQTSKTALIIKRDLLS